MTCMFSEGSPPLISAESFDHFTVLVCKFTFPKAVMQTHMARGSKCSEPLSLMTVIDFGMWTEVDNTLSALPHYTFVCHLSSTLGRSLSASTNMVAVVNRR